jgi:hypothetical protein
MSSKPAKDDLLRACRALARLVKDEYPDGYSLSEIAATWGPGLILQDPLSQKDIDAIARVEPFIAEALTARTAG